MGSLWTTSIIPNQQQMGRSLFLELHVRTKDTTSAQRRMIMVVRWQQLHSYSKQVSMKLCCVVDFSEKLAPRTYLFVGISHNSIISYQAAWTSMAYWVYKICLSSVCLNLRRFHPPSLFCSTWCCMLLAEPFYLLMIETGILSERWG